MDGGKEREGSGRTEDGYIARLVEKTELKREKER